MDEAEARALLTPGEFDALRGVHEGLQITEIAHRDGLSVAGVKYRLKSARQKLGDPGSAVMAARRVFGLRQIDYPSRIEPPKPVSDDSQIEPPGFVNEAPTAGLSVEDVRGAYLVPPNTASRPIPTTPPLLGSALNELSWPWKLALGLLIGFLSLAGVGAALTLGHALR